MKQPTQFIIIKEGFWGSLITDTYTFIVIMGSMWFNYHFIGGSYFISAVLLLMLVFYALERTKSRPVFNSVENAIKHLKTLDKETTKEPT